MTDRSSQLMNQTLSNFAALTIPYSKEENGIVERATKEMNRLIRNILVDEDCLGTNAVHDRNSSVKQPLEASPNTLVVGDSIPQDP